MCFIGAFKALRQSLYDFIQQLVLGQTELHGAIEDMTKLTYVHLVQILHNIGQQGLHSTICEPGIVS